RKDVRENPAAEPARFAAPEILAPDAGSVRHPAAGPTGHAAADSASPPAAGPVRHPAAEPAPATGTAVHPPPPRRSLGQRFRSAVVTAVLMISFIALWGLRDSSPHAVAAPGRARVLVEEPRGEAV